MNAKLHISPQSEENFLPTQTLSEFSHCHVFKTAVLQGRTMRELGVKYKQQLTTPYRK